MSCSITGQPEGRTIFYRVVAQNKAGRAEGATLSFTTAAPKPEGVATLLPTGIATPSGTVLTFEFDDIDALQEILDDGATFVALRLQTEDFATVTIHSRETTASPETRPILEIEFE